MEILGQLFDLRLPVTNTSKVLRVFASIVMYFVDLRYRFMYIVGHSLFDDFLALILHIYVHYWVSDQWSMQFMRFTIITQVAPILKSFTCIDHPQTNPFSMNFHGNH
ncbi:hypothetical protein Hanom_Chr10g00930911 [Helianthus anomalus]